ncbi:MAG: ubiquinol-cytochrome c reductase iron-sulfur subunit [Thermodesulfovibrionales bacterium]|jgi:cytochrome b6-f complex iron-sulfur subunit
MKRREFLRDAVRGFFIALAAFFAAVLWYIYPSRMQEKKVRYFFLMDEADLPRKGVRKVDFSYDLGERRISSRVYLAASGKGITIFSPVCTHLGCMVNWDSNRREFLCPCHGGRYAMDGTVLGGPPPRPLTELPWKVEQEKVYVGIAV